LDNKYFYNGTLRKVVIAMGQILSGHKIKRFTTPNDPENTYVGDLITIPVKYGKGYYYEKVEQPVDGEARLRTILPHISYVMKAPIYKESDKTNERNKLYHSAYSTRTEEGLQWSYSPMPFSIPFEVYIRTKTMDDMLQFIEQFVVIFDPMLTIKIKPLNDQDKAVDTLTLDLQEETIRVKLEDIDIDDTREDEKDGKIECTINFTVSANLYKVVHENQIITTIDLKLRPVVEIDPDSIDYIDGDLTGVEHIIITE